MIDQMLLNHFIAVAQTGSFTRASERLHASQSVVSRSIARLEDQLGAKLIERTTRTVRLTPAGDVFLPDALEIVNRLALAERNVRHMSDGGRAKLRIGVCPSTTNEADRMARGVQKFREIWPQVELELSTAIGNVQADMLRASEIDLGVMHVRKSHCADLGWEIIGRDPLVVAVPTVWNLGRTRVRLQELCDRPWLMPNPEVGRASYEHQLELCRSAGFEPKVVGLVEDSLAARILIASGMAAAFSNSRLTGSHQGADYVSLEGISELYVAETGIVWPEASMSDQMRDLVRCIVEAQPEAVTIAA